jgi:tyrosinase
MTVRGPTTNDSSVQSNNTLVKSAMEQNFPSFQQRLYNLFSNYKTYAKFSNEGWIPLPSGSWTLEYDSIESLHDTIHTLTGLQGHMTWVPFSAFDPIFWMHHAQVDRIFAMWQVLNPTEWITPTAASMPSYNTLKDQFQDSKSPLTPFFRYSNGTFWDSDMVRDPAVFGYTYPELQGFSMSKPADLPSLQLQVKAAINLLYGTFSPASLNFVPRPESRPLHGPEPKRADDLARMAWNPSLGRPPEGSVLVNGWYREWVANVRAQKQALGGSYFIHLLLGQPAPADTDPRAWAAAPNLVGTMSVFASPPGPAADGMRGTQMTGSVPLTSAIVRQVHDGALAGLDPPAVDGFLRTRLGVRVVTADGRAVPPKQVPGLAIRVTSARVRAPRKLDELPEWEQQDYQFDLLGDW